MIDLSPSDRPKLYAPVLVIGYGSSLRGDDAVGLRVAEIVASWHRPGVHALAVPQLTPELAEPIAYARQVLFVDATADPNATDVELHPVVAREVQSASPHSANPGALMALALDVYGQCAEGWIVTIPAPNLELGDQLSTTATEGIADAVRVIARLLDQTLSATSPTLQPF